MSAPIPDSRSLTDEDLHRLGIYHDYDHSRNHRRLQGFYGHVAVEQNRAIAGLIRGRRVLDAGAGYGFLTQQLRHLGFDVTAIDPNPDAVRLAREWFGVDVLPHSVYELPFPDGAFDTVILREVVEHLDFPLALREIARVCLGRIIIFQSNLILTLRCFRALSGHREYREHELSYYQDQLRTAGFQEQTAEFRDVFAFPLSGGYISRVSFSPAPWLCRRIVVFDNFVNRLLARCRLQRYFCWRFLLHACRPEGSDSQKGRKNG